MQEGSTEEPTFREHLDERVHTRLKSRFFIYLIIAVVMVGWTIYHIVIDHVSPLFPFIGFIIGMVIGVIVTRISRISWDENTQQVISRLDVYGVVLLVIYVYFEYHRKAFVGYFVHGPVVVSVSFAVLAGIMIGRVVGIRRKIIHTIEENS